VPRGNHAKFWMVDDEIFYVGSNNTYPLIAVKPIGRNPINIALQEFGMIVESPTIARQIMMNDYFAHMLNSSHKLRIQDIRIN